MNTTKMTIPSNRVSDIKRYCHEQLRGLYPDGEIASMVRMLFEAFIGWDTTQLLLHGSDTINQSDLLKFHWAVEDLRRFRPIQHIIGYTDFCDCRISVSPDVLIPRPETEEIVNNVIALAGQRGLSVVNILDLCTGSGCIAIALAKALPQATVVAVDISEAALAMARANARCNNVEIEFIKADVLDNNTTSLFARLFPAGFDIIVSNPPYVMESEQQEMQSNVTDYEPAMALYVPDNDPLRFYRSISAIASSLLNNDGFIAVEINEKLAYATAETLSQAGLKSNVHKDFRDKERMILATR